MKPESAPRAAKGFAPGRAWLCRLRSAPFKAKGEFLQSPPQSASPRRELPGAGDGGGALLPPWRRAPSSVWLPLLQEPAWQGGKAPFNGANEQEIRGFTLKM